MSKRCELTDEPVAQYSTHLSLNHSTHRGVAVMMRVVVVMVVESTTTAAAAGQESASATATHDETTTASSSSCTATFASMRTATAMEEEASGFAIAAFVRRGGFGTQRTSGSQAASTAAVATPFVNAGRGGGGGWGGGASVNIDREGLSGGSRFV